MPAVVTINRGQNSVTINNKVVPLDPVSDEILVEALVIGLKKMMTSNRIRVVREREKHIWTLAYKEAQ